MAWRVGLGPVFAFEWRMASRRWQPYAIRSVMVLLMLGAMALVWYGASGGRASVSGEVTIVQQVQLSQGFYVSTTIILLGLVGLAAPAATAGAICQDKARGNLTLLFASDLSNAEIVLGKLAARLVPVIGMILCAAPVLAIATLFGGIDPLGVFGAVLVVLACAVFGCSLALTLSIWGRKTPEVLRATYVLGILYLLAGHIYTVLELVLPPALRAPWLPAFGDFLRYNPVFLVLSTVDGPTPGMAAVTFRSQATFLGLGLATSAAMLALATWRIRAVVIRQSGRQDPAPSAQWWGAWSIGQGARHRLGQLNPLRRLGPTPSLDRNPVLWRECQPRPLSRWSLAAWWISLMLSVGLSINAFAEMMRGNRLGREIGVMVICFHVGAGLLLLSISAATSLAEERQRGSLDVLMATPLSTPAIVWGKWWGAFRAVPPLLVLPAVMTILLSAYSGHFGGVALIAAMILSYGAAMTSLGLALATWVPRADRAAGLTVSLHTFLSLGWIPLALFVFGGGSGDHGLGIAAASPLLGIGVYCAMLAEVGPDHEFASQTLWTVFWTIAYGGVALGLLLATLGTFNRCLGRVDEAPISFETRCSRPPGSERPPVFRRSGRR